MMTDLRIENFGQMLTGKGEKVKQDGSTDFGKAMMGAIARVNNREEEADKSIMNLLKGEASIHETMIAVQKSDISMRLLLAVRNKVMDAYREIMRMQF